MVKLQTMESEARRIRLKEKALISFPDKRDAVIRFGARNIIKASVFETTESDFWKQIAELANDGFAFEFVGNHQSHADAISAAKVGSDIGEFINQYLPAEERIKGFVMPFAASMEIGGQGELLNILFEAVKPIIIDDYGVEPVYTATPNDIQKSRVDGTNRTKFSRNMIQGVKDGKSIILLPEGKVEAGRRDNNGRIKGMQKFAKDSVQQSLRLSAMTKDKVALIPFGVSGGYKIYDPHQTEVPWDTFRVGLKLSNKSLFHTRVGQPLLFDKAAIRNMKSERIDEIVGHEIAKLLPENERGFYA